MANGTKEMSLIPTLHFKIIESKIRHKLFNCKRFIVSSIKNHKKSRSRLMLENLNRLNRSSNLKTL